MAKPASSESLALTIVRRLQAAGHVAYWAGGCVRDRVMGRHPKDFDVATSARPEQVLELFPRSQKVGVAFGVVLVRESRGGGGGGGGQVEVATFRTEGAYSDGRHPDSVAFTTAEEDARRRDFTCNGLFFDPVRGEIHDYVGGREDIARRILRAIGKPEARFREDHLRMLRAVRFAAKLAFEIEAATREAIERHVPEIRNISRERIGEELRMILEHATRGEAVRLLERTGLLAAIWPAELWPQAQGGWEMPAQEKRRRIDHLPETCSRALGLAALQRDLPSGVEVSVVERDWSRAGDLLQAALALANLERDEFVWLQEKLPVLLDRARWTKAALKRQMADARWADLAALYAAERAVTGDGTDASGKKAGEAVDAELRAWEEKLRGEGVAPEPLVTGDVLIALGAAPGPAFKGWLESLYDRQLEGELATIEEAREAAARLVEGGRGGG